MNTNTKRTRRGAGTPQRAEMGAELDRGTTSHTQNTTTSGGGQTGIASLLSPGRENAIPLRHLKAMVDLPGREVRRLIQAERLRGVPILSDNMSGYYLPGNDRERAEFIRSMRSRAAEIEAVAAAVERAEAN